jgi:hypothetical protein
MLQVATDVKSALPQSCVLQVAEVTRRVRRFRSVSLEDARAGGSRGHVLSRADSPNGVESRSGGVTGYKGPFRGGADRGCGWGL